MTDKLMDIKQFKNPFFRILPIYLLLFPALSIAYSKLSNNLDIACQQSDDKSKLNCQFRLLTAEPVLAITARSGNKDLPLKQSENYPWKNGITAILFMVDTSDPARQQVIEKNKQQIKILLESTSPHHRIGLASFDKSLKLEVPVGLSHQNILAATDKLQATGKTTELYRSMLSAIDIMEDIDADRKTIFLFSDGLAEDKAYFHPDVVAAARGSNVIITGIGFPRSITQSVALQTLRRLSEETGGLFIEADNNFNLSKEFLNNPFDSIDNGGKLTVDLTSIIKSQTDSTANISINVETDIGNNTVAIPVTLLNVAATKPLSTVTPVESKPVNIGPVKQQQTAPPVQIITSTTKDRGLDSWLWYGVPLALIILLTLIFGAFFLLFSRQMEKRQPSHKSQTEFKPFAYLVLQDETKKRYPITQTTWRIGRSKDNELTLRDNSVSRRHAEIHRDKGDLFTLIDLDSMNGVYVNNAKVGRHRLHEGDIVEIGDVCFRFTLLSADYSLEEVTAMQDTKSPLTH